MVLEQRPGRVQAGQHYFSGHIPSCRQFRKAALHKGIYIQSLCRQVPRHFSFHANGQGRAHENELSPVRIRRFPDIALYGVNAFGGSYIDAVPRIISDISGGRAFRVKLEGLKRNALLSFLLFSRLLGRLRTLYIDKPGCQRRFRELASLGLLRRHFRGLFCQKPEAGRHVGERGVTFPPGNVPVMEVRRRPEIALVQHDVHYDCRFQKRFFYKPRGIVKALELHVKAQRLRIELYPSFHIFYPLPGRNSRRGALRGFGRLARESGPFRVQSAFLRRCKTAGGEPPGERHRETIASCYPHLHQRYGGFGPGINALFKGRGDAGGGFAELFLGHLRVSPRQ